MSVSLDTELGASAGINGTGQTYNKTKIDVTDDAPMVDYSRIYMDAETLAERADHENQQEVAVECVWNMQYFNEYGMFPQPALQEKFDNFFRNFFTRIFVNKFIIF